MNWEILYYILGSIGLFVGGVIAALKWRSNARVESFKAIMEESRVFREELREELESTKNEVESLRNQLKTYQDKIDQLEHKLKEALKPKNWIYYCIQKPLKRSEIETVVVRHIADKSDTVLVIDDDPFTQKIFDNIGEINGWNILRAFSGTKALEMLKMYKPKIIFIDFVMPVIDGFEIMNALHEDSTLSGIPIVVISGNSLKEVDRMFIHTKINESLIKA